MTNFTDIDHPAELPPGKKSARRRRLRNFLILLLAVVALWLGGDFVYSSIIAWRVSSWERDQQWDADGVRAGCGEFSVGSGPIAVLMIHGINDSPHVYHMMAPRLAEHGYAVTVMRLPGFATSVTGYDEQADHQRWTAAVAEQVGQLRRQHEAVIVVAHSLGGAIAIRHALELPQTLDLLVLLAPAVEVSNRRSPLFSTRTWHEVGSRLLIFTRVMESPFANDVADPEQREYPGRTPFTPRSVTDQTLALLDANRGRSAEITLPVMMVLPGEDSVVDSQAAVAFFNRLSSGHKKLIVQSDARHALPVDFGWQQTTDEIAGFARASISPQSVPNQHSDDAGDTQH